MESSSGDWVTAASGATYNLINLVIYVHLFPHILCRPNKRGQRLRELKPRSRNLRQFIRTAGYFDMTTRPTSVLAKAVEDGSRPDLVVLGVELLRLVVFGEVEVGVMQPSSLFGSALPLRLPNCGEPTTVARAENVSGLQVCPNGSKLNSSS